MVIKMSAFMGTWPLRFGLKVPYFKAGLISGIKSSPDFFVCRIFYQNIFSFLFFVGQQVAKCVTDV
jgi:hypothetical protein